MLSRLLVSQSTKTGEPQHNGDHGGTY